MNIYIYTWINLKILSPSNPMLASPRRLNLIHGSSTGLNHGFQTWTKRQEWILASVQWSIWVYRKSVFGSNIFKMQIWRQYNHGIYKDAKEREQTNIIRFQKKIKGLSVWRFTISTQNKWTTISRLLGAKEAIKWLWDWAIIQKKTATDLICELASIMALCVPVKSLMLLRSWFLKGSNIPFQTHQGIKKGADGWLMDVDHGWSMEDFNDGLWDSYWMDNGCTWSKMVSLGFLRSFF